MGNYLYGWRLDRHGEPTLERINLPNSIESLDQATRLLPGGAYTTFRTFGKHRVLRLGDHFKRLEETARLAGHPVALDRSLVMESLRRVLAETGEDDVRVRLTVDLTDQPGQIYFLVETLKVPANGDYEHGVRVVTRRMQRENPKAKLTDFINTSAQVRQQTPKGINETIMVSEDGKFLEGMSSNFFVVEGGVIWTAEEGVLSGITRSLVIDIIHALKIPLRLEGYLVSRAADMDEAFITSASRAVLPVVEMNGQMIGNGEPGPLTRRILTAYLQRIEAELETV